MRAIYLLIFSLLFAACDTVQIKERVVYVDGQPVSKTKVRQWTDTFKGTAITNEDGAWTMIVPADAFINLCIENPRNQYIEACYNSGYLLTPTAESGETEMIRIEK